MVRYTSDDGWHEGTVEEVWRLIMSHTDENVPHIHKGILSQRTVQRSGNGMIVDTLYAAPRGGEPVKVRMRFTGYPPSGTLVEVLEGPLAGSWFTNMFVPDGARTRVVTAGDFRGPGLDDAAALRAAAQFLDGAYEEDEAYLKKLRASPSK